MIIHDIDNRDFFLINLISSVRRGFGWDVNIQNLVALKEVFSIPYHKISLDIISIKRY